MIDAINSILVFSFSATVKKKNKQKRSAKLTRERAIIIRIESGFDTQKWCKRRLSRSADHWKRVLLHCWFITMAIEFNNKKKFIDMNQNFKYLSVVK